MTRPYAAYVAIFRYCSRFQELTHYSARRVFLSSLPASSIPSWVSLIKTVRPTQNHCIHPQHDLWRWMLSLTTVFISLSTTAHCSVSNPDKIIASAMATSSIRHAPPDSRCEYASASISRHAEGLYSSTNPTALDVPELICLNWLGRRTFVTFKKPQTRQPYCEAARFNAACEKTFAYPHSIFAVLPSAQNDHQIPSPASAASYNILSPIAGET